MREDERTGVLPGGPEAGMDCAVVACNFAISPCLPQSTSLLLLFLRFQPARAFGDPVPESMLLAS
jgi:hypothetical protein